MKTLTILALALAICCSAVYAADDCERRVFGLYLGLLHRNPDKGGFDYYVKKCRSGTGFHSIHGMINRSPERKGVACKRRVSLLYRFVLGRSPDSTGLNYHVNQCKKNTSFSSQLRTFIDSLEFKNKMKNLKIIVG